MSIEPPRPRKRPASRRWTLEHVLDVATDRYGLVMLLILTTYVLASALPSGDWSGAVLAATSAVTVIATLAASDTPAHRRRIASRLAGLGVVIAVITAVLGGRSSGVAGLISGVLFAASLVAIIVRISRHDHVSGQTLLGAMCCYVLFGLVYTFLYAAIARLQSSPFLSPPGPHTLSDYLFFSFTTLTTTGYGNLVPVTGLGRALSMLEALMGQLFLVTVVARLVALWIPRRRASRDSQQ
jgi:Ion channel